MTASPLNGKANPKSTVAKPSESAFPDAHDPLTSGAVEPLSSRSLTTTSPSVWNVKSGLDDVSPYHVNGPPPEFWSASSTVSVVPGTTCTVGDAGWTVAMPAGPATATKLDTAAARLLKVRAFSRVPLSPVGTPWTLTLGLEK